jgi:ATP-dependent DNA ligase
VLTRGIKANRNRSRIILSVYARHDRFSSHEIKHDGYRLIVQRDGKRVRLFTCNDHDWSGRFPKRMI